MITFPQASLTELFGATTIAGERTFAFSPTFPCGSTRPRAIAADGVLVDQSTNARTMFAVHADIQ